MLYSKRYHLFLVVYEFSNAASEVVLYWENANSQTANSKSSTMKGLAMFFMFFVFSFALIPLNLKMHVGGQKIFMNFIFEFLGRDAAFVGPNENQFAILDDDKTALALYILPGNASKDANEKNLLADENQPVDGDANSVKGPMQFMFETEVDRIFSTPIGAWGKCLFLV